MIVSHLLGGLGNQMFQYAAGRSLAGHLNQEFYLDVSSFDNYSLHHGFQIDRVFNAAIKKSDLSILKKMLGWRSSKLAIKILKRSQFALFRGRNLVIEPSTAYWNFFYEASPSSYLYGYWQSEKYFKSIEPLIRKDFSFKKPLVEKNLDVAHHISSVNAVSLHVRRGDYVADQKTAQIMSLCDPGYYQRAISHIADLVEKPVFFVFSDDMDWAKKNIAIDFPCNYIDHNRGQYSYIDMQLMSLCKHHIIANSSFSWWGAWLNPSTEKIVVAPTLWFKDGTSDRDLIPETWVRL